MLNKFDEVIKLDLGYKPAYDSTPVIVETKLLTSVVFEAVLSQRSMTGNFESAGFALVELTLPQVTKFGLPNDEAWQGHPLHSQVEEIDGWWSILEVRNSSWKTELERQNKVSFSNYDWPHRHFIITFRESTLECVAKEIRITTSTGGHETLLAQVFQQAMADLSN